MIVLLLAIVIIFWLFCKQDFSDSKIAIANSAYQIETDTLNIKPDYRLWNKFQIPRQFVF